MAIRIPWDKYETAILIDACIRYNSGEISRRDVVSETSQKLRQMAINKGLVIDEIYRNENGISMQFSIINGLIMHKESSLHPATILFRDMVEILENNREEYRAILEEAKAMTQDNTQKRTAFFEWLMTRVKAENISDYFLALSEFEAFAKDRHYIKESVFEIEDGNSVSYISNNMFANSMLRNTYRKSEFKIKKVTSYYKEFLDLRCKKLTTDTVVENPSIKSDEDESNKIDYGTIIERDANGFITLDPDEGLLISDTVPMELVCMGRTYTKLKSWKVVYARFMQTIFGYYQRTIRSKIGVSILRDGNIDLNTKEKKDTLSEPIPIVNNLYVAVGFSDEMIIKKIGAWIKLCHISHNKVIIKYKENNKTIQQSDNKGKEKTESVAVTEHPASIHTDTFSENSIKSVTAETTHRNIPEEYKDAEKYKQVLMEKFPDGYKIDSIIELKKFKRGYISIFSKELSEDDAAIKKTIQRMCIRYEKNVYLPEMMLSSQNREKLLSYIEAEFSTGKKALYYDAIFDCFTEVFHDEHIYNSAMLKIYLENACKGEFCCYGTYISKSYDAKIDPAEDIREYLITKAIPASIKEINAALSHIPEADIKNAIRGCISILHNSQNEYFEESVIDLSQSELKNIEILIDNLIYDNGYASGSEVIGIIKAKYPDIADRYQAFSEYGMREALKYKLSDIFSFNGNIISKKGERISLADIYASYAKSHDTFTIDELKAIKSDLGSIINFEKVYANSVRVSQKEFVSRDMINFDVERIDKIIDGFCIGVCIPIAEISQFGTFPNCGYTWNSFLLEHYVADFSKKYMLLHNRYNETTCAGAIVKRAAHIYNFDELMIQVLAECGYELTHNSAINYLLENGYIASSAYKGIDTIVHKAKQKRTEEGI